MKLRPNGCAAVSRRASSGGVCLPPLPPRKRDIKHHLAGFETSKKAKTRRRDVVRELRRWLTDGDELADRLEGCASGSRCRSGTCPSCQRRTRRWLHGEGLRVLEEINHRFPHLLGTPVLAVTLVDPQDKRLPGQLHTLDLSLMVRRIRKLLERAKLGHVIIVGGVDFSFNVDDTGRKLFDSHWSPHCHLLVVGITRKQLKNALDPHLKRDRTVKRPLHICELGTTVDDVVRRTSYGFKSVFNRIVYFIGKDTGKVCRKKLFVESEQVAELGAYLDRCQPTDRLVLRTVRRHGWRLVLMPPKTSG